MVPIRTFDTYCKHLQTVIPAITSYIFAATEDHLVKKIKDKAGVIMAVVIPSANPASGSDDALKESNTTFIFVVKKLNAENRNDATELNHFEETQNAITAIKNRLIADKADYANYPYLYQLNEKAIHTDPEFNIFGGYDGWSISLEFTTPGF